jgi:hypothetical protein
MKAALICVALFSAGAAIVHNIGAPSPVQVVAASLPQGMQCDATMFQTGMSAGTKDRIPAPVTYKFVNGYWMTVPQKDNVMRPLQVTDDAYVLVEAADETKTLDKGIVMHMVSTPLAINRETGDITFTGTTTTPNDPKVNMKVGVTGHCLPVAFNN